jgi:small ligand-binding sensory domain FIST
VTRAHAATGISLDIESAAAGRRAAADARVALGGAPADLALVFVSPEHASDAQALLDAVRAELAPAALAGCVTESVVAGAREHEGEPAAVVLAAHLPGTAVRIHHVVAREVGDRAVLAGLPADFSPDPAGPPLAVLADPYTFPASAFLEWLNDDLRGVLAVGGMASGIQTPGEHVLMHDDRVLDEGALVLEVSGRVELHALVSQGCTPIGPDLEVTRAERNVIVELDDEPAYQRLVEIVQDLGPEEREAARNGLMAGIAADAGDSPYARSGYLMRGILGAEADTGTLAIGDRAEPGQTVRFHLRDARGADQELRAALRLHAAVPGRILGGVLFACNGRGTRMFGEADHDAGAVREELGELPLAGMFCAGEVGPVGGVNALHAFTATMALLVERPE